MSIALFVPKIEPFFFFFCWKQEAPDKGFTGNSCMKQNSVRWVAIYVVIVEW